MPSNSGSKPIQPTRESGLAWRSRRKLDRSRSLHRGNRFEAGGARPIMLPANARRLHVRKRKRIDEGPQLFAWAGCRRQVGTGVPASSRQTDRKRWYWKGADGIRRIEITTEIASVVIPPYSAC
jgi:hypothetical protein